MTDRALKALSLLLGYPSRELQSGVAEIGRVLYEDSRFDRATREALRELLNYLEKGDIYELEERYVALFDRSRTLSLNLFEHVHGESRDRGGAMVSLVETYRAGGLEPETAELPDHLPLLLEFLSTRPASEARETLADAAHILEALGDRLGRKESPYCAAFLALARVSGPAANRDAVAEQLARPDASPDDLEALDRAWEESEVRFGPDPGAGCPQAREMLARVDELALPPRTAAAE